MRQNALWRAYAQKQNAHFAKFKKWVDDDPAAVMVVFLIVIFDVWFIVAYILGVRP